MMPDQNMTQNYLQQSHPSPLTPPDTSSDQNDDSGSIDIRDFFVKCLINWKWFVISIIFCLGCAGLYMLRTPKIYTRTASVMIKDEQTNPQGISSALSDLGLFQTSSDVANEVLAFQSPALIGDVIKTLGLETSYTYRKFLRPVPLYADSMVVKVEFPDLTLNEGVSLKLRLKGEGKAEITTLTYDREDYDDNVEITLGDTVKVGPVRLVVTPGPNYSADFDHKIGVSRMPLPAAIEFYKKKLNITLASDDATVIDFTINDESVARANDILNTLIDLYNKLWVQQKEEIAVATSKFIDDRLAMIQQELGDVDSDIADYKGEHLVPDLEVASGLYMQDANENTKKQVEVSTQIAIIQYLADYMQSPLNKDALLPANSGIENPGITRQIEEFNTKQLERTNLLTTTGVNSPLIKDRDTSLTNIKNALVASLRNQEQALKTQLSSLIKSDRATNAKIASSPGQAKYLLSVERQQKVKESLYLFLLQKREENELSLAFTPYNTRIITPPFGPLKPTAPIKSRILLMALVIGLFLPAVIIFINENMNGRVRSREDLEGLRAPLLGEIPEAVNSKSNRFKRISRRWRDLLGKSSVVESAPELFVHEHGRSILNESFRMLRANLEFVTRQRGPQVLMTTSFNPGSGKSFITLNLAASVALKRKGRKVLVIDLDLRRGSLSRVLTDHSRGISDYLSESTDDVRPYIQESKCKGLYILPVGTIPPNPSELLYSDRLQRLLETLKGEYDHIFLDCPPADVVADATIITPLCDTTIFVVRAGLLDRRMIPELDRIYMTHRFNSLLVVLNGTTLHDTPYRRYAFNNYYLSKKEE